MSLSIYFLGINIYWNNGIYIAENFFCKQNNYFSFIVTSDYICPLECPKDYRASNNLKTTVTDFPFLGRAMVVSMWG